ncbi:hypothetical protein D3C72_1121480 [compost metagenome]
MVRFSVSAGMSRKAWKGQMPALETKTSTLPKASTAACTKAAAVSGRATSPSTEMQRRPWASTAAITSAAAAPPEWLLMATSAPCLAISTATAAPMPRDPPVMRTTLSLSSMGAPYSQLLQGFGVQPRSPLMALAASVTVLVSSAIRASDMYWAADETLIAATTWPSTERIGAATQRT